MFELITIRRVKELLEEFSKDYSDTTELDIKMNHHKLIIALAPFLKTPKENIQSILQNNFLKTLGQHLNIDGFVTHQQQLPMRPAEIANQGPGGGMICTTAPDTASPQVVDLSRWSQLSFFIAQLFSLSVVYAQLKSSLDNTIETLENNFVVKNMKLKHMLELEVFMLANAYVLRKGYDDILKQYEDNDDDSKKEASLNTFIEAYLTKIAPLLQQGCSFCIPCGATNHAIYLMLDYIDGHLEVRVDNPSKCLPKVFVCDVNLTELSKSSDLLNYLRKVILAMPGEIKVAKKIIYNKPLRDNTLRFTSFKVINDHTYKALSVQTVKNCVVSGYYLNRYRRIVHVLCGENPDVFHWLCRQQVQQFVRPIEFPSNSDFSRSNGMKMAKLFVAEDSAGLVDKANTETITTQQNSTSASSSSSKLFKPNPQTRSQVSCAAILNNEKIIIARASELVVVNIETEEELLSNRLPKQTVIEYICILDADHVLIHDTVNQCFSALKGTEDKLQSLRFEGNQPDSKRITAMASQDTTFHIHNKSYHLVVSAESPQGKLKLWQFKGAEDGTAALVSSIIDIGMHGAEVSALAFCKDGNYIVSACCTTKEVDSVNDDNDNKGTISRLKLWGRWTDGSNCKWSYTDLDRYYALEGQEKVTSIISRKDHGFITASSRGTIHIWELSNKPPESLSLVATLKHLGKSAVICQCLVGDALVSAHQDKSLKYWNLQMIKSVGRASEIIPDDINLEDGCITIFLFATSKKLIRVTPSGIKKLEYKISDNRKDVAFNNANAGEDKREGRNCSI